MYEDLMKKIKYQFTEMDLLQQALSHRSFGKEHNERLEFLGDSILNCIIAIELFNRFPKAKEGKLSRIRANLVNGDTLSELAKEFKLGAYLRLGPGEIKSGGAERSSILADTVEAIIVAIYKDSDDINTIYKTVVAWYKVRLDHVSLSDVHKDPKSLLQELLQSRQQELPHYKLISITGAEHAQHFKVACITALFDEPVYGEGKSRRRAEQEAAQHCLERLKETAEKEASSVSKKHE